MMKFEIYILQKKSQDPKMYQEAMGEYLKRLGAYAKVSVIYKKNAKQVEMCIRDRCKTVFDIAPAYLSAKSGDELRASLL